MATSQAEQHARQLADDMARATAVVQKLTSSKEEMKESLPRGTEAMPRSELHYASGLAFTFVKKAGVGLSFEHGHGFVIAKLPSDKVAPAAGGAPSASSQQDVVPVAPWTWSAPLFINVNAGGFGVTLGYTEIDSVIVLDTPEAVHAFSKTVVEVDSDVTGAAGSHLGAHLPATAAVLSNLKLSDKEFTYSVTRGVMVDVSLTGLVFSIDAARNAAAYGEFASPGAVLEGGVAPPAAAQELYTALDRTMKEYYAEEQAGRAAHAHAE